MKTIDVWRIVTLLSAAERAKVNPSRLAEWARRYPDFPPPFLTMESDNVRQDHVSLYDWLEVDKWLQSNAPYGFIARGLREKAGAPRTGSAQVQRLDQVL